MKLHYALVPYLMAEGAKAWQQQKSLMTFLDKADYRYLLGPDVLVAPMIASGTKRTVVFPAAASWIYLFDKGKVFAGGSSAILDVPLGEFPVFLKQGSTIASTLKP